jgi:SulP family sulfate permease
VHTRVVGVVVAVAEVAVFLTPVAVMAYIPNFFFAATLVHTLLVIKWCYGGVTVVVW